MFLMVHIYLLMRILLLMVGSRNAFYILLKKQEGFHIRAFAKYQ